MNTSKIFILIILTLITSVSAFAQTEKFDVTTFKAPKGWQKSVEQNAIQFTKQNGNAVGIIMLFKSIPTSKDSKTTFDASWDSIVKGLLTKVDAPKMNQAVEKDGWTIESGAAVGEKDGDKLVAMLLSATGGEKVVNLLVLFNSEAFQTDVESFISSIDLPKVSSNTAPVTQTNLGSNKANPSSLVGLWTYYTTESNGYSNGFPQLTGGYMRREYLFKADGTYQFRLKNWMVLVKDILFISESGTWSINGNTLTIKPTQGKGGWWSKAASGRTVGWGSRVTSSDYKLETVAYTFELRYSDLMKRTDLILRNNSPTERDGKSGSQMNEWTYSPRDESLIDNPPDLK